MNKLLLAAACSALTLLAADFKTGQAARAIIGQRTFSASNETASATVLGGVGGVAYAEGTLLVTDANRVAANPVNHRVLLFQNLRTELPGPKEEIPLSDDRCPLCTGSADVVLGQPDFTRTELGLSRSRMRLPTAVAFDGKVIAVADTGNNRILIWLNPPATNDAPADVVLGQENFTTVKVPVVDNRSFRAPQGVWIQDNRLYVADTQNHRVMIWNSIPTTNHAPADIVVGQPDFTTAVNPNLSIPEPTRDRLLNPTSVTTDGNRLYVSDLGHNRVLIWQRIPTTNGAPADVVLGQPDFTSFLSNNSEALCQSTTGSSGTTSFPARCAATMDFPRFVLSDGRRIFIADSGNDRVLVYNRIPILNGARADVILGQPDEFSNIVTDQDSFFSPNLERLSSRTLRAPQALAWDGISLYVTDPFARRVAVFSLAENLLSENSVRNAASLETYAVGTVTVGGTIKENDEGTIKIGDKEYKYKVVASDTLEKVVREFTNLINAGTGDPNVVAVANPQFRAISLSARKPGEEGNRVTVTTSVSSGATLTLTASGATLSGGQANTAIAPGTIVSVFGENLSATTAAADPNAPELPRDLGGVQAYVDGIRAPLQFVSPTQVNLQIPFEIVDANSSNIYIRTTLPTGVQITQALNIPVTFENPGIFAVGELEPRQAVAVHGSSFARGLVSVDGSARAGDTATILIEDREYTYTVVTDDTLAKIRDGLIARINAAQDEKVTASAATSFTRIILQAKTPGPEGNGIAISTRTSSGANVILTATRSSLCCANTEGSPITQENPAVPGEVIKVYATGLGLVGPAEARREQITGKRYTGPAQNEPNTFVSALAGGRTANVISAAYKVGFVGLYEVVLELAGDLPTNPLTQLTIAQNIYVSNVATFPVVNPTPPENP